MSKEKIICFFSSSLDYTGAPKILLAIIKKYKTKNPDHLINVISLYGGPLISEFKKLAKVVVINRFTCRINTANIGLAYLQKLILYYNNYDIAFFHTTCTLTLSKYIRSKYKIFYTLEYLDALEGCFHKAKLNTTLRDIDEFIFGNEELYKEYASNNFVTKQRVSIVEGGFYGKEFLNNNKPHKDVFRVIGCGVNKFRKGLDLFYHVAELVHKHNPSIQFQWIGDLNERIQSNHVKFIESNDPKAHFMDADVFLLTSRFDAFPLVVLENAMIGNAIICFNKNNGIHDLISENNCGTSIEYLNTTMLAEAIEFYYSNSDVRFAHTDSAKKIFFKFDEERITSKVYSILFHALSQYH